MIAFSLRTPDASRLHVFVLAEGQKSCRSTIMNLTLASGDFHVVRRIAFPCLRRRNPRFPNVERFQARVEAVVLRILPIIPTLSIPVVLQRSQHETLEQSRPSRAKSKDSTAEGTSFESCIFQKILLSLRKVSLPQNPEDCSIQEFSFRMDQGRSFSWRVVW